MFRKFFFRALLAVVSITGIVAGGSLLVYAQDSISGNSNDAYDYPIRPDTEEWKQLHGFNDMLNACQIPENVLKNMSTAALVETVLDYPLLFVYTAHNDWQQGFDMLVSNFNGLQELFNRKDAGGKLLVKYIEVDPKTIDIQRDDFEKCAFLTDLYNLQMILSQQPILKQLSTYQTQVLLSETETKHQLLQNHPEVYGALGAKFSSMLIEQILGQYDLSRYYWTYIYTPMGSPVLALQMEAEDELTPSQITYIDWYYDSQFPYATRIRSATQMYNCHSYAWHNQASDNTIWLDAPYQAIYWNDGSYSRWTGVPYNGLIVRYVDDDHSAIIHNVGDHRYISKWGSAGLYVHSPSHCPYTATTLYYY
ncbi:MAG: hypothetical protein PHX29_04705 [Dehalococcoidales bacterium]|jgi:hypothetical protein|nr:hypothetical protein [Dehalococcoidales bacterium]